MPLAHQVYYLPRGQTHSSNGAQGLGFLRAVLLLLSYDDWTEYQQFSLDQMLFCIDQELQPHYQILLLLLQGGLIQ